jgi:hypothetical protein
MTLTGYKVKYIFVIFPVFTWHEINIQLNAQLCCSHIVTLTSANNKTQ